MTPQAHRSPLQWLVEAAATQVRRWPNVSISVLAHVVLLVLLYYWGSYQVELRQQEVEVASSLRDTHVASTGKRLRDLQTIKELLEKSANRADTQSPESPAEILPQTPQEMVERARELSREIDALDQEIQAEELAELLGEPEPVRKGESPPDAPPQPLEANAEQGRDSGEPETDQAERNASQASTEESVANEVAGLEAKARSTLARRQQRLEAKANGVQVQGSQSESNAQGVGGGPSSSSGSGRGAAESVRQEISEFMKADRPMEQSERWRLYTGLDFFHRGNSEIPSVDASTLVRGRGRMLGAGGEYANRVYLNTWYIIGPFPGRHEADLFDNPSYPPEQAVLLDAVYFGKDKRLLKWRYVTAQSYPLVPPDSVEDSVYYGYTEVFVDKACDLTVWIGSDDDVQIYLNDQLAWAGGNVNKQSYFDAVFDPNSPYLDDYNRTEGKRVLHFKKGRNKIFFKLSNGPNDAYLSMVLTR